MFNNIAVTEESTIDEGQVSEEQSEETSVEDSGQSEVVSEESEHDWKKDYDNLQPEFTKKSEELAVLRGQLEALGGFEKLQALQDQESGVSLDEESINLIRYQQAYQASARFISTIDRLLDIVINQLGV